MLSRLHGVKVFSATKARDRDSLGETITSWLQMNSQLEILDIIVRQSSDNEFHCLSVTILYANA